MRATCSEMVRICKQWCSRSLQLGVRGGVHERRQPAHRDARRAPTPVDAQLRLRLVRPHTVVAAAPRFISKCDFSLCGCGALWPSPPVVQSEWEKKESSDSRRQWPPPSPRTWRTRTARTHTPVIWQPLISLSSPRYPVCVRSGTKVATTTSCDWALKATRSSNHPTFVLIFLGAKYFLRGIFLGTVF